MKHILSFIIAVFIAFAGTAQNQYGVGSWKDHLSYYNLVDVCEGENGLIYAATSSSLFSYDKNEGTIERISKLNLLSDVRISAMEYDFTNHFLIIGYENGNLDLLINGKERQNLPDIKLSSLIGDKRIYNIVPYQDRIYLATGFGIVVVDPFRNEVKESYLLGTNGTQAKIGDIAIRNGKIYAGLPSGILRADLSNPILANFQNWTLLPNFPSAFDGVSQLEFVDNKLMAVVDNDNGDYIYQGDVESNTWSTFLNFGGLFFNNMFFGNNQLVVSCNYTVLRYDNNLQLLSETAPINGSAVAASAAIVDIDNSLWIADLTNGLHSIKSSEIKTIVPQGPRYADARRIAAYNNNVWVAHGGVNASYGPQYKVRNISYNLGDTWQEIINPQGSNTDFPNVLDFMSVAIDPTDNNHIYLGSWEEGLIEIRNNQVVNIYNESNSTLKTAPFTFTDEFIGVASVAFDVDGNLWMTNSFNPQGLQVRNQDGTFYAYNLAPIASVDRRITEIEAAQSGYIWVVADGQGLIGYNPNGTLDQSSDDIFKLLTDEEGLGNLNSKDVFCIKEDLDGELWIGTLQGLCVLYNQDAVFNSDEFDAETILIEQGGNIQELLATEAITSIEIDGGNRKWIGTQSSGVFLFSPDGIQEILHFTTDNSPLLTNNIIDIAINQETGEVFFITESGIISYFGDATNFSTEINDIKAYPNPVRETYDGIITIDGLAYQSVIKITDLQGNLVFETVSEGGRATWNGLGLNGERPATGVYLIYASSNDGSSSNVGKIAFIK